MRAILQRVSEANVSIGGLIKGAIRQGLVVLVAVEEADDATDIEWMCGKIIRLRVFDDEHGVMNRSIRETEGGLLVISQFTLFASTRKGNRPSYIGAAKPEIAIPRYKEFLSLLETGFGKRVQSGEFGAHMLVHLVNDGPVTIILDSKSRE